MWTWNSDAFGSTAPTGSAGVVVNLRFPGQYYDMESGLYYNYHRDYDPNSGRYAESDPIGLRGGINTYGYVGNNPLTYIDPLGLYHSVGGANINFTPTMQSAMHCMDQCTGRDLAVTSGVRPPSKKHPNSSHSRGEACDLGRNANAGLSPDAVKQCFAQCFQNGYGQEENNGGAGTHYHLQLNAVPGGNPGFAPSVQPYNP